MSLVLAACSEPNPILGEWKLDKSSKIDAYSFNMAKITGNARITFEEERMVSGNKAIGVSYSVSGDEVTVSYPDGKSNTYTIVDKNQFTFDIPEVGTFHYVRVRKRL